MLRYVSMAYGTRAEIQEAIENSLSATRSERRRLEARQALADLEAGDCSVQLGRTTYLVTDDTE